MRASSAAALTALLLVMSADYVRAQQPQHNGGSAPMATKEQRVALVIGNSAYVSARLRNPANDARAMAERLKALGFDVTLKTESTRREMDRAIVQFGESLAKGGVALFYFAGHGLQVRGRNFLLPIDAEISTEAAVRSEAVDVEQVLDQLGPVSLSMVILDACRNNPFERRFRGIGDGGLAQIDAPKGTLIAYATAPGRTAADGTGENGVYTRELLRALEKPGLKVEDVFKQVRINVSRETNDTQVPWEASSLVGEFYFRADTTTPSQEERLRVQTLNEAEMRGAFFGNTLTGGNPSGSSWNVYISRNGTAHIRGKGPNGNAIEDTGVITIENDSWCNTWKRIGRGEKNCTFIERQGDRFVNKNVDGSINSMYIVRAGNPDDL
jgi:hypothetical protein